MNLKNPKIPKPHRHYVYLTRKEAAEYLRITLPTFKKHRNEIPFHKFGRRFFYTRKELNRLVRPCTKGGIFIDIRPWKRKTNCTYLTRKEAAEYLKMSTRQLTKYLKKIPSYKFSKHVLYIKEELDEMLRLGYRVLKSRGG
ncbi:MAG: helix-turn-helix domain-containing protein [Puniceicoccales bacterium]|jgi:excisionase family DNA binding protein|nr:helix-turn-helix domain-containing protein [Puniceicoccales bacterium]